MALTLTLACLAGGNVLLTLLIQWYVITSLGIGGDTDALFAGIAVPQLIIAIVATSSTLVLIPLLATEKEEAFDQNVWTFFLILGGFFALVALVLIVTAEVWVRWLVPGFPPEREAQTAVVAQIQLVTMVLSVAAAVPLAALQARRRFVRAELSSLLSTCGALAVLFWLFPVYGVYAAATALGLRAGLQIFWLAPGIVRWERPRWTSPAIVEAWRRVRPLLFGASYFQADPLLDRFLASMWPAGGLSSLYLAQQVYGAANVVKERAIAAPMSPTLAVAAQAGQWQTFKKVYHRRLLLMGAPSGIIYLVMVLFGELLLRLVIGYGGVTAENVRLFWWLMVLLGGVYLGGALGQITSKTFYAIGDTRTPIRISVVLFSIYIPCKIVAFVYYGLPGLAVAVSIYVMSNLVIHLLLLEKFIFGLSKKR